MLPATLPVTRIFFHYPTRTLPEVKKPYPSQPGCQPVVCAQSRIAGGQTLEVKNPPRFPPPPLTLTQLTW